MSQTHIPRDQAVDVEQLNANRWLAAHPAEAFAILVALFVLLQVPIIGWVLRKLLR